MGKTIYFLGAGFSKDAGGPIQNELIKTLFNKGFEERLDDSHKKVLKKFKKFFKLPQKKVTRGSINYPELEDILTPLDRCISNNMPFKSHSAKEVRELRESFHTLLAEAITYSIQQKKDSSGYIKDFAKYINKEARKRADKENPEDRIAIFTTNWDTLLDYALYTEIQNNEEKNAGVDYCCHISSWDYSDETIKPGLWWIAKGGYNIKYLKLHGSMNWAHCRLCQRLYVHFKENLAQETKCCRHCQKLYSSKKERSAIELSSNLLLPTFLKDTEQLQIKLIWHQAALELAEAEEIVFIGYSLPQADFEVRQLFSRFTPINTKISVVIYPNQDEVAKKTEKDRYRNFFQRKIDFKEFSVPKFVETLVNQ